MVHYKKKVVGFGLAAACFFIIALLVAGAAMGGDGGIIDDRIADLSVSEIEGESGNALVTSSVTSSFNYQGRLTDSADNPLNGTYDITFRLYDTASGGTALAEVMHSIFVNNGLFVTRITFDPTYFDGRALWLGIQVGYDPEMTPRQALRAVPYALSLRPGAVIEGSLVDEPLLSARNSAENGKALHAGVAGNGGIGVRVVALGEESQGVRTWSNGTDSMGVHAITTGDNSEGVVAETHGADSVGVGILTYRKGSHAVKGVTSGNDSAGVYVRTYGNNSPAVIGLSEQDVGVVGVGNLSGGYFTTTMAGSWTYEKPGVNVSTQYDYNPGVIINTSGIVSNGIIALTYGPYSKGVSARTYDDYSGGVSAYTYGNYSEGVYAHTTGDHSDGVHTVTSGHASKGVYALTTGANSPAVHGESALGTGVFGKGYNDGVKGESTNGNAVHGQSTNGSGGYFTSNSTNEWIPAIYGRNDGAGDGVYGWSLERYGTVGVSSSDTDAGVWGFNHKSGIGVLGEVEGNGVGVMGVAPLEGWAADFRGNVKIRSSSTGATVIELGEGLDYAEGFDVSNEAEIEPGTVMSIDSNNPGKLTVCHESYDRKVAGIVAGAGGLGSAVRLGGDQFNYDVALAGRVYCNVDATHGAVAPGDLLTTSPTSGYAMVVEDYSRAQGAILGKAMEGLEEGQKGQILVLVTLQ